MPKPRIPQQKIQAEYPVYCVACEGTGRNSMNNPCYPCKGTGMKEWKKGKPDPRTRKPKSE